MAENALFICALRDGIDEAMGMVGRYADWLTTALAISCLLEPKILKAETRSDHLHCEGGAALALYIVLAPCAIASSLVLLPSFFLNSFCLLIFI